jgi:hypothetical protein
MLQEASNHDVNDGGQVSESWLDNTFYSTNCNIYIDNNNVL